MKVAITICFIVCFLLSFGQQQRDSMLLPYNFLRFQDSSSRLTAPRNHFINDSSVNQFNQSSNFSDPFGKITDNRLFSETANQFKNPLSGVGQNCIKKPVFHGTTSIQTQFIENGYAPASANGFYTTASVSGQVTILKIPLNAGVAIQMHDNQFRLDYTAVNLNFDADGFKNDIKDEYQKYIGDIKNYFGDGLGQIMEEYKDSADKLENYKSILLSSNYYDRMKQYSSKLTQLEDSLLTDNTISQAKDSLHTDSAKAVLTNYYNRIKDTLDNLKGVRDKYKNVTAYVNKYKQYSQMLDEYNGYVEKVKAMNSDEVSNLPGIQKVLKKRGLSVPKFDFLSRVQKMNIGRIGGDVSRYTFRQQTLYGVQLDYLTKKKIYIGGAFGWASQLNMQLTPSFFFNSQYKTFDVSRLAGYLRTGYGSLNANHVHIIWTGFGDKFNNGTIVFEQNVAHANGVLAVEFLQKIGKVITMRGEAATSHSSNSNRIASIMPLDSKPPVNYALYTAITGDIKATKTKLTVQGEVVSADFLSMTALFLRRGIAGYSVGVEQSLFKNKVTYSGMLQHNFQNFTNQQMLNTYISSSNMVIIQASQKAAFQLYYGWFGNMPGSESIIADITQTHNASLTQQYSYGAKKVRMVTLLTTVYSYSGTQAPEKPNVPLHNFQQGAHQQFVFPKQLSWNIGAGGLYRTQPVLTTTENNTGNTKLGYWVETGNTFSVKKITTLKYQLKYLYDPILLHQMNIAHSIDINLYRGLRLNLSGLYYVYLTKQYSLSNRITATAGMAYSW